MGLPADLVTTSVLLAERNSRLPDSLLGRPTSSILVYRGVGGQGAPKVGGFVQRMSIWPAPSSPSPSFNSMSAKPYKYCMYVCTSSSKPGAQLHMYQVCALKIDLLSREGEQDPRAPQADGGVQT